MAHMPRKSWVDRLRDRKRELGLTDQEIGDKCGVTKQAVGHWLNGRRGESITALQIDRLAAAIGRHPAWLLYGVDPVHMDAQVREARRLIEAMAPEQRAQAISVLRALAGETKPVVVPKANSGGTNKGAALALVSVNPFPQSQPAAATPYDAAQGQLQRGQGSALMLGMMQADTIVAPFRGQIIQPDHAVNGGVVDVTTQFVVIAVLVFTLANLIKRRFLR